MRANPPFMKHSAFQLGRLTKAAACQRASHSFRTYSTRSEFDLPLAHLRRSRKPYVNWKVTSLFFALGCGLTYSEAIFDYYKDFTALSVKDELLPIRLEYELKSLPIYQRLTHAESDKWVRLESWENLDHNVLEHKAARSAVRDQAEYRTESLHTHTLAQPGGILIKPVIFHNIETDEGVTIIHVGLKLCGYPFIVHGGIIATILNETFKRKASLCKETASSLKDDFKVDKISISYKFPTFANQFLIIKTKRKPSSGDDKKHCTLETVIESQKGRTLVKSEAALTDTGRGKATIRSNIVERWFGF